MFDRPDIGWPSAMAQQSLQAGAIPGGDLHVRVNGKAAVVPGKHLADISPRILPPQGFREGITAPFFFS
jgi:hypothetical protein